MEIQVKLLRPDATLPSYANEGDAGCDLVAVESRVPYEAGGGRAMVPTGFAVAIPEGHAGFVLPRSGLAAKHGVTCINAPGLIDAGYRGEVMSRS
jgi:dUTP pyrophosphatase